MFLIRELGKICHFLGMACYYSHSPRCFILFMDCLSPYFPVFGKTFHFCEVQFTPASFIRRRHLCRVDLFFFFMAGLNSRSGSQPSTAIFVGRSSERLSMWPMHFRVCFSIFQLMLWMCKELRKFCMLFLVLSIAIWGGSFYIAPRIPVISVGHGLIFFISAVFEDLMWGSKRRPNCTHASTIMACYFLSFGEVALDKTRKHFNLEWIGFPYSALMSIVGPIQ